MKREFCMACRKCPLHYCTCDYYSDGSSEGLPLGDGHGLSPPTLYACMLKGSYRSEFFHHTLFFSSIANTFAINLRILYYCTVVQCWAYYCAELLGSKQWCLCTLGTPWIHHCKIIHIAFFFSFIYASSSNGHPTLQG